MSVQHQRLSRLNALALRLGDRLDVLEERIRSDIFPTARDRTDADGLMERIARVWRLVSRQRQAIRDIR